ncbi:hypothetical protein D9615_007724 [Tricholomella constricta]|uniref:AB hydrolase-1 domain-containing protein n=1 Tax=Tricholomella constricta TaxID=117010 RepID=A0A8H5M0D9_9AGAR|nr:hypothetical protein D9615_007724 [Tricholomella constricta]
MDPSLYKSVTTRRSLKYSYYFVAPTGGKPVLLFVHGFPNTSNDWRYQVAFFKAQGYGLIVPDMLGYGGTDKPTDYPQYTLSSMSQDVIDILDAEKVEKAVAVGHDWGSILVSRLANYHPDRFIAFAFLAAGYAPPSETKFEDLLAYASFHGQCAQCNRDLTPAYRPNSASDMSFLGTGLISLRKVHTRASKRILLLAEDPKLWVSHVAPTGALKAWVEADKRTPTASYLSEEEVKLQTEALLRGGLEGPLCWYKVRVSGVDIEDGKGIAPESYFIQKPVFFGGATQDCVCLFAMGKFVIEQHTKGPLTVKEYETGHWVMWQAKDKLNQDLLEWFQTL